MNYNNYKKIKRFFSSNFEEAYTVNSITKKCDVDYSTAKKGVKELLSEGHIISEVKGCRVLFRSYNGES